MDNLPKTWQEVTFDGYYTSSDSKIDQSNKYVKFNKDSRKNEFATRALAEASLALAQLSVMREIYRQGWHPDWNNDKQSKFVIISWGSNLTTGVTLRCNNFLAFQSYQVRDLFLKNFKNLIREASPLIFG